MALWNEKPSPAPAPRKEPMTPTPAGSMAPPPAPAPAPAPERSVSASEAALAAAPRRAAPAPAPIPREAGGESVIAANLTIEGKIEGSGHVRIAGSFKGDVNVQGNLTIEVGARVTGQVRASTVIVGGELHGNIEAAARVELQETGMVVGDVKGGSLTVAAGSRMRGQVEFGWGEKSVSSLVTAKVDAAVS